MSHPAVDALAVECPTCPATVGEPCLGHWKRSGKRRAKKTVPHSTRWRKARRAQDDRSGR